MSKRNPYWQIIREICILVVIIIHCPSGANYPAIVSAKYRGGELAIYHHFLHNKYW